MHAIVTNLLYKGNEEYLKMSSKLSPFFTYLEGTLRKFFTGFLLYHHLKIN